MSGPQPRRVQGKSLVEMDGHRLKAALSETSGMSLGWSAEEI